MGLAVNILQYIEYFSEPVNFAVHAPFMTEVQPNVSVFWIYVIPYFLLSIARVVIAGLLAVRIRGSIFVAGGF